MGKYDLITIIIQGLCIYPGLIFIPLWVIFLPMELWIVINIILFLRILKYIDVINKTL
jgi:hypothetical protein